MGTVTLPILVGGEEREVEFQVIDFDASFTLLFGRPWLTMLGAVASTIHRKVKFIQGMSVITIFGDKGIGPRDAPVLEVQEERKEDLQQGDSILTQLWPSNERGPRLALRSIAPSFLMYKDD